MAVDTAKLQESVDRANLVSSWIPALEGVQAKLEAGARVADVGCGFGSATILLAQAFPRSRFFGYDNHEPSVLAARQASARAGVVERVYFQVAGAVDFPGWNYDLIACFDCLSDMANPVGVARRVRSSLTADGTWMIVEPRASGETWIVASGEWRDGATDGATEAKGIATRGHACVLPPLPLATPGSPAGDTRLREVLGEVGFSRFRCACATAFHWIFEVRV